MKKIIFILFYSALCLQLKATPQEKIKSRGADPYEIIFVTFMEDIDTSRSHWLDEIKNNWGATGVSLYLSWDVIQPTSNGGYDFDAVDTYIELILSKNLDLYIRIPFAYHMPAWTHPNSGPFSFDDYQITRADTLFQQYDRFPLNFASDNSKQYMTDYLTAVVDHLHKNYSSYVKEIAPSTDPDAEFEYNYGTMLGYSQPEVEQFREYLTEKYGTIGNLGSVWGQNFSDFDDIDPRNLEYNWELLSPQSSYYLPKGRFDWINFRELNLKKFIDECAEIIHKSDFLMGLQLGSIYDEGIERRGWYDPTMLFENVDAVKVADIAEYRPNFTFAADYLRTICQYWGNIKGKTIKFSNESNWAYYPRITDTTVTAYTPARLCSDWTSQLESYYNKGANAHYIFGWSTAEGFMKIESLHVRQNTYSDWRNTLSSYSHQNMVTNVFYPKAIHLSGEQVFYIGNLHSDTTINSYTNYWKFELLKSVVPRYEYIGNSANYDGACDILTNFMLKNSPYYLSDNYSSLSLTKSSNYMPNDVYKNLMMSANNSVSIDNATWWEYDLIRPPHGEFRYTQALYNEYGEKRSPIHLVWKTRPDLMAIWPDANLPDTTTGHHEDFVSWAYNYGCGHANNTIRTEYPGWEVKDSNSIFDYDKNIRTVWNRRTDLHAAYPHGHYQDSAMTLPPNMISWVLEYGYLEPGSPEIQNYNYWPYIGDGTPYARQTTTNINNSTAKSFKLSQNYPNPFNPVTKINYSINSKSLVDLKVYDITGREVAELVNSIQELGEHSVTFNGSYLSSGIYFYRIIAGNFINVKKMVLIK